MVGALGLSGEAATLIRVRNWISALGNGSKEIWSIAVDENLERSRGDLGAVLELDSSDDVSEELVSI